MNYKTGMSFRHLLSPILRRFGVSGSTTNTQQLIMTKEAGIQTNIKKLKPNQGARSTSIVSSDEIHADEAEMPSTKLSSSSTDILTQECGRITLRKCKNSTVESTNNIKRDSSCDVTVDTARKQGNSTKNNKSIKNSTSSDELSVTTGNYSSENGSKIQEGQENDRSKLMDARSFVSSIKLPANQSGTYVYGVFNVLEI